MIDAKNLPAGWVLKPLRACVAPKQMWHASRQPRERIRYIELSGVDNQRGVIAEFSDLAANEAPSRAKKIVRSGDVIFATTRPNLKNIAVVPPELDGEICSTGFCVLRPLPNVTTSGWLFALCRSDVVISQVVKHDEKNAYPSVSDDEVLDALVPVPKDIVEQQRLVARIEALTRRLEEGQHARKVATDEASSLLHAVRRKEFAKLIGAMSTRPLGECGRVLGGGTPSKGNPDFWNGNIPWVTAKEMWNRQVVDSQLKISEAAMKASPVKLIPANSVLFVVRGSILFRRVPVAVNRIVCTINQDMKAIVPHDGILGDYLAHMMWAVNQELQSLVDTAGNSAGKLETDKWSAVEIPIPNTTDEQRRIVARLDALEEKHSSLRRLQTETEAELAAFTPALLDKAFRGEL